MSLVCGDRYFQGGGGGCGLGGGVASMTNKIALSVYVIFVD